MGSVQIHMLLTDNLHVCSYESCDNVATASGEGEGASFRNPRAHVHMQRNASSSG